MEQITTIRDLVGQVMQKKEEIKRDRRRKKEDISIEEIMSEKRLIDDEIKDITNDLGYKRFRGEKIDDECERNCEIKIEQLLQDYNGLDIEMRKKERVLMEEKSLAVSQRIKAIRDDDDEYSIQTQEYLKKFSSTNTPDLPIEEPDNLLSMGDEHLNIILETKSDEVIKSSVEILVPIPSESEGISEDTCDVPTFDNDRINVESELVESLINRDTLIVYSSKINPILEEFTGELAHIAPIPPGIVEADFDPNDGTSSNDDDLEDVERYSSREIIKHQSLKDNPTPIPVTDSDSSDISLPYSDNSLPEFESFSDHTEETRSGSTTTHANYSLPEYESFHFDNPSFPRPPPEPPDVEISLDFEPDTPVIDNFNELNEDQRGSEIDLSQNVEDDDSFTFIIRTFLPFLTYPTDSPLLLSTGSEDTIFDPGIST
ncbi:hypothetical protein Tco_0551184 [Tanacetum coccineum]